MSDFKYTPQLRKAIIRRRPGPSPIDGKHGWNVHQFGQADDARTNNGATGCTDTCLQWLFFLWTGVKLTHNDIRRLAGFPPATRGLYPTEVARVIKALGLPYHVHVGTRTRVVGGITMYPSLSAHDVREKTKLGPVIYGHEYASHPDWRGYHLGGVASDGKPNGFARPLGQAGHTQKTWNGAHAATILGVATSPTQPDKVYVTEPNHNSPARPEKPTYDVMTVVQFDRAYNSYHDRLGRFLYAIVPTRALPAKGY